MSLYFLDINLLSGIWLQMFSPILYVFFHFLDCFFCCTKAFQFDVVHLFIFAFVAFAFGVISKKSHCQDQYQEALPLCFLLGVLWFLGLYLSF